MKKHILAGVLLGASVVASAQTSIIDKVFAEGVRDSAVDANGNLFIVNGDGSHLYKIDHNGNIAWSQNFAFDLHHVAVKNDGAVGVAYNSSNLGIGVIWVNGFTGTFIAYDDLFLGSAPDEFYDLVGSDHFYLAYREAGQSHLFSTTGSDIVVSNNGSPLEPSANPLGGVAVAIRDTTALVRHYDPDGITGALSQSWEYNNASLYSATKNIRINHRADGSLLVGFLDDNQIYWAARLGVNGAQDYLEGILSSDAAYGEIPRPVHVDGEDTFFDFYLGDLEGLRPSGTGTLNYTVLGPATEPDVCAIGTSLAVFGAQVSMFDSSFSLLGRSTWTLPANNFDSFARPDGSMWVVENGAASTRIIRYGNAQKVVKDMFVMNEDQAAASFNVLTNDVFSWVGGTRTVEWQSLPSSGLGAVSNEATNGTFTFTPTADQSGAVDFQYRVVHSVHGPTAWQNVRVVVKPVNDRPVGVADSYSIGRGQLLTVNAALGVLDNDTDADNHSLTAVFHKAPQRGTLNLANDGSFTYQAPMQAGTYTFLYRAKDVSMHCAPVTVTITVN